MGLGGWYVPAPRAWASTRDRVWSPWRAVILGVCAQCRGGLSCPARDVDCMQMGESRGAEGCGGDVGCAEGRVRYYKKEAVKAKVS